MNTFTLVRTEHLNHHGFLFGGQLLKWVDELAWLAASRDYPGHTLVTRAIEQVEFRKRVINGSILRFEIDRGKQGKSSVVYHIEVFADSPGAAAEDNVFSTRITFVCIDAAGNKCALPVLDRVRSTECL